MPGYLPVLGFRAGLFLALGFLSPSSVAPLGRRIRAGLFFAAAFFAEVFLAVVFFAAAFFAGAAFTCFFAAFFRVAMVGRSVAHDETVMSG